MSHATDSNDGGRLSTRLESGLERLLRDAADATDESSDETLAATAVELWDVVDAVDGLLETVDLETLPEAVEVSTLPDLLDLEELPTAIRDRRLDPVLDLDPAALRRAIHLRELWNTVDLVAFRSAVRRLSAELEDVVDAAALESEAAAQLSAFVDEVKADATNAALQQRAKERQRAARAGVIEGHRRFERLYESTRRGSGYAGRRPVSKNPTAVSSVPYGPLPASVSTRVSTVPANVRGTSVDALPRIYGRRWRRADGSR